MDQKKIRACAPIAAVLIIAGCSFGTSVENSSNPGSGRTGEFGISEQKTVLILATGGITELRYSAAAQALVIKGDVPAIVPWSRSHIPPDIVPEAISGVKHSGGVTIDDDREKAYFLDSDFLYVSDLSRSGSESTIIDHRFPNPAGNCTVGGTSIEAEPISGNVVLAGEVIGEDTACFQVFSADNASVEGVRVPGGKPPIARPTMIAAAPDRSGDVYYVAPEQDSEILVKIGSDFTPKFQVSLDNGAGSIAINKKTNQIFVAAGGNEVQVYDPDSGAKVSSTTIDAEFKDGVELAADNDGNVFAVSSDHTISIFRNGSAEPELFTELSPTIFPKETTGRIVMATSTDGLLFVAGGSQIQALQYDSNQE